jgi:hypothetical protein
MSTEIKKEVAGGRLVVRDPETNAAIPVVYAAEVQEEKQETNSD